MLVCCRKKLSGISSVLQSLSKKPKISTLVSDVMEGPNVHPTNEVYTCMYVLQEKSKLDWNQFKADEGLEHELSQQRKDRLVHRTRNLEAVRISTSSLTISDMIS